MKAAGKADKFEVVFCSADHSEPEFKSYFQSMAPWLAIDYEVINIKLPIIYLCIFYTLPYLLSFHCYTCFHVAG